MIGTIAGSYRITDVLSVGGMGTVYRAEHTLIGRLAAVKVLLPEMSSNEEIVQRFFNEAKATTSIKHPGIVEIYDYGNLPSGHAYIVMEFLEGRTLSQRNKQRSPVHEAEAAALLRGVCGALAAAHAKHIVHRDLKPDNIFLVPDADSALGERAKILDFGIAKLTDIGLAGNQTKTGAVMGTPTYMSPEQCKGTGDVDHRADLYSIGCIFYEMVAGRPPFTNKGAGELIGAHLFMQPEPPSRHGAQISPEAEALIMALLAKNPAQRPQTAAELAQLLTNLAARGGYGSAVNWERPSMPSMPSQAGPNSPTHYTPSHTSGAPVNFTPAHYTPHHTPYPGVPTVASPGRASSQHLASQPSISIEYGTNPGTAEKPTTLSGAASEASTGARGGGAKKWIAIVGGLALAGGAVAAFLIVGGGGTGGATADPSAASAPSSATGTPASALGSPASGSPASPASGATATATERGTTEPAPGTAPGTAPATATPTAPGTATAPGTGTAATGTAPAPGTAPATATPTALGTATAPGTGTAAPGTAPGTGTPDSKMDTTKAGSTKTATKSTQTKTTNSTTKTKTKAKTTSSDPLLETDL